MENKKNILALDLGISTGWASDTSSGSYSVAKYKDHGERLNQWQLWLDWLLTLERPSVVVFELPIFVRGSEGWIFKQAGALERLCWIQNQSIIGVSNTAWKKKVCGHGHAPKAEIRRITGIQQQDEADARGIWLWATNRATVCDQ